MSNNNLRGMILFALAIDSTPAEVENVQNLIDSTFKNINSISPTEVAGKLPIVAAVAAPGGLNTPAPAASTSAEVQLDSEGLPYDERIHSGTKGFNANGTWRARRNVDAGTVAKVKAELKATVTAGAGVTIQTEGAAPSLPAAPALPPLPAPPPALPLPPLPAAPENARYAEFVQFIASNTGSATNPTGRLTPEWVRAFLVGSSVPNGDMQNLAHNPALLETVFVGIQNALKS